MVRFRTDGVLYEKAYIDTDLRSEVISIIKVLSELDITEKKHPQDGNFYFDHEDGNKVEFRVATAPTPFGENVVLRLFIGGMQNKLEDLGFEEEDYKKLLRMSRKTHGIIFVVGPTGSGKTTTLYSIIERLNQPSTKIITVEDPIERHIKGVQQAQVKVLEGKQSQSFTFADGIKNSLRQDADIIMLGEIRDQETASVAVQAALTGHLVLTTVHAIRSDDVISRLKSIGVETYLLASAFNGVVAQRLVKKLCQHCKKKIENIEEVLNNANLNGEIPVGDYYTYGDGCENCNHKAIVGRTGLYEVLMGTESVKELIFQDESTLEIRKKAIEEGMRKFEEQFLKKAQRGEIALEEAIQGILDFS